MFTLTTVLIIAASIILILIVLVQNPKGGGLSSSFGGGGNQFGGVVQTNKFLDKSTWSLAIALLVLSITASLTLPRSADERESATKKYQNELNTTSIPDILSPEQIKETSDKKEETDK